MRALIQRVRAAQVEVDNEVVGSCGPGLLIFLGVGTDDTLDNARVLWDKILRLRIFSDAAGKTNLSLLDVGGEVLVISQFTLYADCRKGNRPGFTDAGSPEHARELYEYVVEECRRAGYSAQTGEFGADMKVSLVNDGPFTIMLDEHLLGK
jgi:D-tyrosyl-tRNA(Tyr) deacylase